MSRELLQLYHEKQLPGGCLLRVLSAGSEAFPNREFLRNFCPLRLQITTFRAT